MNPNQQDYAWKLWMLLHEAADLLWECFEQPFVDYCIAELETESMMNHNEVTEQDFGEDDLPF